MKIKFYGHACFGVEDAAGTRVITDPYEPGSYDGAMGYGAVPDEAKVVTVSHDHEDHNYVKGVKGGPEVLKGDGGAAGLEFKTIAVFHDESQGSERGASTIFSWEMDGIKVCHLGDLGHALGEKQIEELALADVVMVPVGGHFTIDAKAASQVVEKLKAKIVIPMHYKTAKCGFPIAGVDDFLAGKKNVRKTGSSELELSKDKLPTEQEIVVLEPLA